MAALAGVVALVQPDLLHALRMTPLAGRRLGERDPEVVRLVATGACRPLVGPVVGIRELSVARGAGAHVHHVLYDAVRVGIVASDAFTRLLRMVRMHVLVAGRAGCRRRRLHVVRGVAVRAAVVGADAATAE